jgi:uncharacterized protein YndB with AHSA1/START domain
VEARPARPGGSQVPDAIERELILAAPPERVWLALTDAQQLGAWFGTRAEVDLRPGGAVLFEWDKPDVHGTNRGVIDVVEPPRRFAWRWRCGPDGEPMTRVEFTLEPHPAGTRLRVVESGFSRLPPERRAANTGGWQRELSDLQTYLESRVA